MNQTDRAVALSRVRLAAYGVSAAPLAALGLPFYVFLPGVYAQHLGAAATGVTLLLARVFDVLSDPLIGHVSDQGQHWRRRREILVGLPLLCATLWWLFHPAASVSAAGLLAGTVLAYLGWTLIYVPYLAWGAELTHEPWQHARIAAAREGFTLAGTLAAVTLPWLLGVADDPAATLAAMAVVLVITLPVTVGLTVSATPLPPEQVRSDGGGRATLKRLWTALGQDRALRRLLLAQVLNGIANGLPASLFLFYVIHVLQAREWLGGLLVLYFFCAIAALPLWVALGKRIGKPQLWRASMLLACAAFVWVPLLGAGDIAGFVVICVVSGAALGADLAIPASMQSDLVSHDASAGPDHAAGLYFGLWGMATKLAQALAVGIALPLAALAGFDAAATTQPALALTALSLLYGAVPVLFKFAALASLHRLPWPAQPVASPLQKPLLTSGSSHV